MRKFNYSLLLLQIFLIFNCLAQSSSYAQTGSLDPAFGDDGIVITSIGASDDIAYSTTIQTDGKILVAGYSGIYPDYDVVIARYNSDGSLDNSFGDAGIVVTNIDSLNQEATAIILNW